MSALLVTGGAGFIGSHCVDGLLKAFPDQHIVNIDKLTYAGNLNHLLEARANPRHHFIQGDICDQALLEDVFASYPISGVFHLAAESHVDNSIAGPKDFIETNIIGTFCLLEQVRKQAQKLRFLHVSTDEVYGSLQDEGHFTENSPMQPNSPYSASKASSDLLVRSYHKTYGLDTVTTNCSNNFGPRQHAEKLIPTIVRKALSGQAIPIYGTGLNVRDWLYVTCHVNALIQVFRKGVSGEVYNIGGSQEWTNLALAKRICQLLDETQPREQSYSEQIEFVTDRQGHDYRYAIDSSKVQALGWGADPNFDKNLLQTIQSLVVTEPALTP